jgi:hypothetical protein
MIVYAFLILLRGVSGLFDANALSPMNCGIMAI